MLKLCNHNIIKKARFTKINYSTIFINRAYVKKIALFI